MDNCSVLCSNTQIVFSDLYSNPDSGMLLLLTMHIRTGPVPQGRLPPRLTQMMGENIATAEGTALSDVSQNLTIAYFPLQFNCPVLLGPMFDCRT